MKSPTTHERRKSKRRILSYYLPVLDNNTGQVLGHLVDISPVGFLMDSKVPVQTNKQFDLRFDLMEAISGKASLEFKATSKWCRPDTIMPYMYNAGFEITEISPEDIEAVKLIGEKYAAR